VFNADASILFIPSVGYINPYSWDFSSYDAHLWAVNTSTLTPLWHTILDGVFCSGPGLLIGNETVWIVSCAGYGLVAVDTMTGTLLWNNSVVTSLPYMTNESFIVAAHDRTMVMVNNTSGEIELSTELPITGLVSRIAYGYDAGVESVIVTTSDDEVVKVFSTNGTIAWSLTLDMYGSPQALSPDKSAFYIPGMDGLLYAVNTTSGSISWSTKVDSHNTGAATVSKLGDQVFVGARNGGAAMYSLNANDGSVRWKYSSASYAVSVVVSSNGRFVCGLENGGSDDVFCVLTGEGYASGTADSVTNTAAPPTFNATSVGAFYGSSAPFVTTTTTNTDATSTTISTTASAATTTAGPSTNPRTSAPMTTTIPMLTNAAPAVSISSCTLVIVALILCMNP